jgi:hypothetical protein
VGLELTHQQTFPGGMIVLEYTVRDRAV